MKKLLFACVLALASLTAAAGERAYFYSEVVPGGGYYSKEYAYKYNTDYYRELSNQREMEEMRFQYELERDRERQRQEEFEYVEDWRERYCDEYIVRNRHSNYYKRDCR